MITDQIRFNPRKSVFQKHVTDNSGDDDGAAEEGPARRALPEHEEDPDAERDPCATGPH